LVRSSYIELTFFKFLEGRLSEVIYGRKPVLEALRSDLQIDSILLLRSIQESAVAQLVALARKSGVAVRRVSKEEIEQLTGSCTNQGMAAILSGYKYYELGDLLKQSEDRGEPPLIALLDGIQDPHNVGAILRSADGAGVHGVVLPKKRSAGITGTVAKTSAGASAHVMTARVSNLNYTIGFLKGKGIWFVGADEDGDKVYTDADLTGPIAVVIGSEGEGLHRLVKEKCDFLVRIPMYGQVNSLNASVAAGLLFFEIRRQRGLLG
jgi:23S rRNA (guanosine2251-2'-O)-methyltransferase